MPYIAKISFKYLDLHIDSNMVHKLLQGVSKKGDDFDYE